MTLLPPKMNVPATPALDGVDINSLYDVNHGKLLGKGGFSEVLAVRHVPTGEIRALKVMDRASLVGKKGEMVAHEKEILRRTCHPGIIMLHEAVQTPDRVFFALDLMNEDLFEFIVRNKIINEPLSRAIMHQIMSAIAYLHEQSIVHRDIKPENILINAVIKSDGKASDKSSRATPTTNSHTEDAESGAHVEGHQIMSDINKVPLDKMLIEVKIADFGLAKVVMEWDVRSTPCGTSFYIAPEVIRGIEEQGAKPLCTTQRLVKSVDVWSAGVVLYVLLCGRPPFHGQVRTGQDRRDLLRKIDHGVLFNSKHGWDAISDEAKDLVSRMLDQETTKRITADEVLRHPFFTANGYPHPVPAADPRRRMLLMQQRSHEASAVAAQAAETSAKSTSRQGGGSDGNSSTSASVEKRSGSVFTSIKDFFGHRSKHTADITKEERQRMHAELAELQADLIAEDDQEGDVTSYKPTMPVKEAKPARMAVMNSKAKVGPDALRK